MRGLFMALLLISADAFAQPLEPPRDIFQASDGVSLSNSRVAFTTDSSAAFFVLQVDPSVAYVFNQQYYFHDGGWSRIGSQLFDEENNITIDAAGDGQGGWYFAALEELGIWSRLTLNTLGETVLVHEGNWFWPTEVYWESTREAYSQFSHRPGGGTVFSAIFYNQWGIEVDMTSDVRLLPPGSPTADYILPGALPPVYLSSFCAVAAPAHDSLLLLAEEWPSVQTKLFPISLQQDTLIRVPVQCTVSPPQCSGLSRSGNFLVFGHGPSSGAAGVREITPDGSCVDHPLVVIPTADYEATAFHPDYGFAVVTAHPHTISLARLDTLGGFVSPIGVLYETNADYEISSVDADISGNGRVVVTWIERSVSATDTSKMRFTSLGWNTILASDNPQFIPHPSSFTLSAYPNPFNSTLRVSYELPHAQQIELAVFNVLGQKVETLFSGPRAAGMHEAVWTPHAAGGIYFVTLRSAESVRTQKVLYLR